MLAAFTVGAAASDEVAINAQHFPDDNFRAYVETLDADQNGVLSFSERGSLTRAVLVGKMITDLKGIEYFPNLEQLFCQQNKLRSIDVSANTKLRSLNVSLNSNLGAIDVSANTALTWFACTNTGISTLNVTSNTALTYLACGNNALTSLDLSKNVLLEELSIESNPIAKIDLTALPQLNRFTFSSTPFVSLDLSGQNGAVILRYEELYYLCSFESGTFDLSTLPDGFDAGKTSNWVNATRSGDTVTVDAGATEVKYDYDCGNGQTVTFVLTSEIPAPDGATDDNLGGDGSDDNIIGEDTTEEWKNPYSDISDDHPNIIAIEYVTKKNVFIGTDKNNPTFSPEMKLTRAQFVTIFGRMAGVDVTKYTKSSFTDVDPTKSSHAWFAPYVEWASEQGIVLGYGDGTFGPTDELTIEQALAFLARYARFEGRSTKSDASLDGFKDVEDISNWARADVQWAVANNIYTGSAGNLQPKKITDRLLTAIFIYLYDTTL